MTDKLTNAQDRLFTGEHALKDVKLFPGHERDISKDALADQVLRVVAEMDAGTLEIIEYSDDD